MRYGSTAEVLVSFTDLLRLYHVTQNDGLMAEALVQAALRRLAVAKGIPGSVWFKCLCEGPETTASCDWVLGGPRADVVVALDLMFGADIAEAAMADYDEKMERGFVITDQNHKPLVFGKPGDVVIPGETKDTGSMGQAALYQCPEAVTAAHRASSHHWTTMRWSKCKPDMASL